MILPIFIISLLEFKNQNILWVGFVPNFLRVDDISHVLAAEFRNGFGAYRARATFSTALGLAEYMTLLIPFSIHNVVAAKLISTRVRHALYILMAYLSIEFSGSRLGFMGMMISILLYALLWGLTRWRKHRADLFAPALLLSYPAFFVAFVGASFFVRRIHNLVWGGGETAGSNEARKAQLRMAMPRVLENPIGHGAGMSGDAMGYAAGRFVTVDNYAITIALDYGLIGLICFFGMFLVAMWYAAKYAVLYLDKSRDPEAEYLLPLGVSLGVFVVVKLVLSQPDNHPIPFMMLGMIVALIYRLDRERRADLTIAQPLAQAR
jgi:O-antigen ligase